MLQEVIYKKNGAVYKKILYSHGSINEEFIDHDQDGVFDACWTDIDIEDGNGETSWCGEIWEKDKAPLMPDVYVALAEDAIRFAQARLDCRP